MAAVFDWSGWDNVLKSNMKKKYPNTKQNLTAKFGVEYGRAYESWTGMKWRCRNHPRYKHLKVCLRWKSSFDNFIEDMGLPPPNFSLDRIDNDKGYNLSNCRWASNSTQARNRRNVKLNKFKVERIRFEYFHKGLNQQILADKYKVSDSTIGNIVNNLGWLE